MNFFEKNLVFKSFKNRIAEHLLLYFALQLISGSVSTLVFGF